MHVDVIFEVIQLQRHTFELPVGYYPSPKRIFKAIEGKKHSTTRDHKIGIAVKKDCQVTISPLLQHMLGFKRAIFLQGDHVANWVADVTRGVNSL